MSNMEKATNILAREFYVASFTAQWARAQEHVTSEQKEQYASGIRSGWDNGMVPQVIKFDFGEIALPAAKALQDEDLLVTDDEDLENWERPSWL